MRPRSVLITGAAQGIGAALARAFYAQGDLVILLDASETVMNVANSLDKRAIRALPIIADVRDETSFATAFRDAATRAEGIDIMINNAARTPMVNVWDIPISEWDDIQAVNLRGTFLGTRLAGAHMRERGHPGRIINMTSIAGQRASMATGLHYAASKAGILAVTRYFAQELARDAITVNALAPAAIDGPMLEQLDDDTKERLRGGIPVGRFGRDNEVASSALYLASAEAGFITGATLDINGGLLMR